MVRHLREHRPASIIGAILLLFTVVVAPIQAAGPFRILVFGDSLSAAYGMNRESGWVALLRERLAERNVAVVNRSVSGETTAGGLQRLPAALEEIGPDLVVIELGANDGLRGQDTDVMRDNLSRMIDAARSHGAAVLLLGMRLPPNYGPDYTADFENAYAELAAAKDVALEPFFLATVAEDWDLMQADGIHPNAEAQPLILDHVWPSVEALLPGD